MNVGKGGWSGSSGAGGFGAGGFGTNSNSTAKSSSSKSSDSGGVISGSIGNDVVGAFDLSKDSLSGGKSSASNISSPSGPDYGLRNPTANPTADDISGVTVAKSVTNNALGFKETGHITEKYTELQKQLDIARINAGKVVSGLLSIDEQKYQAKNIEMAKKAIDENQPGYLGVIGRSIREGITGLFSTPDYVNQKATPSYEFAPAKSARNIASGLLDIAGIVTGGIAFSAKSAGLANFSSRLSKAAMVVKNVPLSAFKDIEPDATQVETADNRSVPNYGPVSHETYSIIDGQVKNELVRRCNIDCS